MKTGLKRECLDKFYTKTEIVALICKSLVNYINFQKSDLIIEPSAGNGNFISEIKKLGCKYECYDIEPDHEEIKKADFLTLDIQPINGNIHVIGNPPFGRQSCIAIKFIKKITKFANTISFILPKSFKKPSMQKHFDPYFHLCHQIDLPSNSFLVENKEYDVPCIFQIWVKKDIKRIIQEKVEPIGFLFVKKTQHPDISFRRVGVNAGKIDIDINKSEQSHYFIKLKNINDIDKLKNIKFLFDNTVGPKSISKQELILEFNRVLI